MSSILHQITEKAKEVAIVGGYLTCLGAKSVAQAVGYASDYVSVNVKNIYETATETGKIDPDIMSKLSIIISENEIDSWIKKDFEARSKDLENISSEALYADWARLLNENFIFNFYGRLFIIDYIKGKIDEGYNNYTDEEKKLNIIALLYAQLRLAKDEAQFNRANLFPCWNREDQRWLTEVVFPLAKRPQQITQLLGKALSYNNPYNAIIGNISEVIQLSSVIKEVIKIDFSSSLRVATDSIDPSIISPFVLLNKADRLLSNVIPGYYSGKDKKKALDVFDECVARYNFFISLIPNELKDTRENNKITLDCIVKRDYNYLGHKKFESFDLRKALLNRILNLEALKFFSKIEYKYYKNLSYNYILNKLKLY